MMKKVLLLILALIPAMLFAQQTYVPDDKFEQTLIDLGYDTGLLNDSVPTKHIDTVTFLNVGGKYISDLTGIEDFKALTFLGCYDNALTSLDVSGCTALTFLHCYRNVLTSLDVTKNTALKELYCYRNVLTSLDVSGCTALTFLHCGVNKLTSLDVSGCTALTFLHCGVNKLTSLDVTKNTALEYLDCSRNGLTSLDVSKNTALDRLFCQYNGLTSLDVSKNTALEVFDCSGNFDLYCIQVLDSANAAKKSTWYKDQNAVWSEDCSNLPIDNRQTYVPDGHFEQALIDRGYDTPPLNDSVPTKNINTVTHLDVSKEGISDLTGIEDFKALTVLYCYLAS